MKNYPLVICISNEGYGASLELKKIYEVVADPESATREQIRIIDESGEDYLYPSRLFIGIDLPESLRARLSEVA